MGRKVNLGKEIKIMGMMTMSKSDRRHFLNMMKEAKLHNEDLKSFRKKPKAEEEAPAED